MHSTKLAKILQQAFLMWYVCFRLLLVNDSVFELSCFVDSIDFPQKKENNSTPHNKSSSMIELVSGNEARDGQALSSNPSYKYTIEF